MAYPGVVAKMDGFVYEGVRWDVTDYTMYILGRDVPPIEVHGGYKFSGLMKQAFRQLNRGDKILIEGIKAVGPGGKRRQLSSVTLEITL